jgi:SAM-dependent methyltransferase
MLIHCPICGHRAEKFDTYSGRKNARCPSCGVMERHRLLWLFLERKGLLRGRILDVAHMEAIKKRMHKQSGMKYYTLDRSAGRNPDITADLTNMPQVESDSFDGIICYHVLEHILDDRAAMREMFRVLKPGGWAILQSPVEMGRKKTFEDPSVRSKRARRMAFGDPDHVRIYGRDYKDRLERAGFRVKLDKFALTIYAKKYAIDPDEIIWFCKKEKAMTKKMKREEILEMFAGRAADMIAKSPVPTGEFKLDEVPQKHPQPVMDAAMALHKERPISSVLDLGCGVGRWFRFWTYGVGAKKLTGIEPVEALAAESDRRYEASPDIEVICGQLPDLDNRPTREGGLGRRSWDLGFTFTVLGHVPPKDIEEVAGILKKRCRRLILIEPVTGDCFGRYTFKHDHAKLFGPPDFQRMVDKWKAIMVWKQT